MLAHVGPVRAAAGHPNLSGRGKEPVALAANPVHDALGHAALQQLHQRINASRAISANGLPASPRDGRHRDLHRVELGAADLRPHRACATLDPYGIDGLALHLELGELFLGFPPPVCDWDIGPPFVVAHRSPSFIAAPRSRATSFRNSSSPISVRCMSAPPSRKSPASCFFDSIMCSIFSSTVPWQTNLCTSTFLVWPIRKARSVAWFSTAGFHHRSKWMTCEAAVRLSPAPPALRDSTKNG